MMLGTGLRTASKNEVKINFGGQTMIHALVRLDETTDPFHVDYFNLGGTAKVPSSSASSSGRATTPASAWPRPVAARPADFTCRPEAATRSANGDQRSETVVTISAGFRRPSLPDPPEKVPLASCCLHWSTSVCHSAFAAMKATDYQLFENTGTVMFVSKNSLMGETFQESTDLETVRGRRSGLLRRPRLTPSPGVSKLVDAVASLAQLRRAGELVYSIGLALGGHSDGESTSSNQQFKHERDNLTQLLHDGCFLARPEQQLTAISSLAGSGRPQFRPAPRPRDRLALMSP